MAESRSDPSGAGGLDLHLEPSSAGVRAGLESALREAIRTGRLAAGVRLPSSRQLAGDLGVARNTVADSYTQLVAEGWLTARQGSGTVVAQHGPSATSGPAALPARRPGYDLGPGVPDLSSFPATAWVTALRRGLAAAAPDSFGYGSVAGLPQLRTVVADYLARTRGVYAAAERVVICTGFTQALALIGAVLRRRGGRTVAVEGYSNAAHRRVLIERGLELEAVPVDDEGADVAVLGGQDAVLLTPAHQFPLGPALSPGRRNRLIGWAARSGALVIEDDYDGEFRYDRHPVGAVQGLAPESVAYVGTTSKSLVPGLRLGWAVLPAGWVDDVVAAKADSDGQTGVLEQLALAQLIIDGGYDRHIRRMRLTYRRRRDRLVTELARHQPRAEVRGIAAGLHLLIELPTGLDEATAVSRALEQDLVVEGLAAYHAGTAELPPALVIGYGTPPAHSYTGAVARLISVLSGVRSGPDG